MQTAALKKVATGLVLALPVLLVLDYLQYQSVHVVAFTHQRVVRTHEMLREIDAVASKLNAAEAAARDYLSSGETVALNPFETSAGGVRDTLGRLTQMAADDAASKPTLQTLEPLVSRRIELLRQSVALHSQKEFSPEKLRPLDAEGRKLEVEIQTLLDEMEKAQLGALEQRQAEARASVQRATFITPFAAVLGLWLVALAALLLYRDASERKWKGVERRMHTKLLETLPVSIFLADEGGLIFYTNAAHDALFGYDSGDLIGRHAATLLDAAREDADPVISEIFEKLNLNGHWTGELVCRRKDGATFRTLVRASNMELPGKTYRVFALQDLRDRPEA
jgi:PAS domain S-box-containing protein